ncbi:L-serine dehydratase [Salegentibacter echinorum]|uniref:L-serine dehydratase n=1 Tax=Salegentibacter echinorum TaxID=1073325 RepID=A0A1M5FAY4_SALEC|nr:L-serine ammonia-lyase [Salegentibacter echinorum]SHF88599.1 L-serine dehydratase [Salegentibacter echinorum]
MRKIECISVFDMLKVGVGPSSSHTLGPWRASQRWIDELKKKEIFNEVEAIHIDLYGSLSLTGKGHATDIATILGLCGHDPVTMDIDIINPEIDKIRETGKLSLNAERTIDFSIKDDVKFNKNFLEFHPNGMTFRATLKNGKKTSSSFYSIGGGFVVKKERKNASKKIKSFMEFPFSIEKATELLEYCDAEDKTISEIVLENEKSLRSEKEIDDGLRDIWKVMLESMYIGCHTEGTLPGGLNVKRRSFEMHQRLIGDEKYDSPESWITAIRRTEVKFRQILKWVSCFAISVNEVNASLGRVVTAPTNGSAGTLPSVMMYYMVIENHEATFKDLKRFMLVAGEIGSLFKKGATISAAMGGCQAEIGVSSAMAAGGLTELLGGSPAQVLMAAEIAMEHHLGLTCDPIGGLVQVPCIERNAMGAIKAINAAEIALESDATKAKVPLDKVIATMWDTAKDMNSKYKETSEGGLAVKVNLSDC